MMEVEINFNSSTPDCLRILPRHVQEAGHCLRGAREWAKAHNLDFRKFIYEGILYSEIQDFEDAFSKEIKEVALKDYYSGNTNCGV